MFIRYILHDRGILTSLLRYHIVGLNSGPLVRSIQRISQFGLDGLVAALAAIDLSTHI